MIRRLEQDGWLLVAQRGSHRQYRHPAKPTVAGKLSTDVPLGTLGNIYRQAGLTKGERDQ